MLSSSYTVAMENIRKHAGLTKKTSLMKHDSLSYKGKQREGFVFFVQSCVCPGNVALMVANKVNTCHRNKKDFDFKLHKG